MGRPLAEIQADIDPLERQLAEVLAALQPLRRERKSALASIRMSRLQADPAFRAKVDRISSDRMKKLNVDPAFRRKAADARWAPGMTEAATKARRLPPMTAKQRGRYFYLRECGISRPDALIEVLKSCGPSIPPRTSAAGRPAGPHGRQGTTAP